MRLSSCGKENRASKSSNNALVGNIGTRMRVATDGVGAEDILRINRADVDMGARVWDKTSRFLPLLVIPLSAYLRGARWY